MILKNAIIKDLKRVNYIDPDDMVYRLQLTYNEIMDILDVRYFSGSTIGYTIPPGVYEISDFNLMLKSLISGEVKVNNAFDDTSLKSIFITNKTIRFTKKSFFLTYSGFTESYSGVLYDFPGSVQLIRGGNRKAINQSKQGDMKNLFKM